MLKIKGLSESKRDAFDPDRTNRHLDKNKVLRVGVFFSVEKMAVKKPSLPCKAPQNDHKNTTNCTPFSQKTQQKRRFTSP